MLRIQRTTVGRGLLGERIPPREQPRYCTGASRAAWQDPKLAGANALDGALLVLLASDVVPPEHIRVMDPQTATS